MTFEIAMPIAVIALVIAAGINVLLRRDLERRVKELERLVLEGVGND